MGRRIVVMKLICSLGHCECDCHTVQKLSERHLTADCLAPREGDGSRMHSTVSSDWLPVTSRPRDRLWRYSKQLDAFRTALLHRSKPSIYLTSYIFVFIHVLFYCGPGQLSQYCDSLRAGRSGDRIPVGVRIFAPAQTCPGPTQPPILQVPGLSRW